MYGGAGNDSLYVAGSVTKSTMDGGDGDDTLIFINGAGANPSIVGGSGNDFLSFTRTINAATVDAGAGSDHRSGRP